MTQEAPLMQLWIVAASVVTGLLVVRWLVRRHRAKRPEGPVSPRWLVEHIYDHVEDEVEQRWK